MSKTAIEAFSKELESLVDRFRVEWDFTYAEAIGCLELAKADLITEINDEDIEEENEQL